MTDKVKRPTPETARRALEEAEERRRGKESSTKATQVEKEFNGRKGLDPARYGDWENKGIASDF